MLISCSSNIHEDDFCNIQCDCCLETKCYKWNDYPCWMFRTYEFMTILYFLVIIVHAFVLLRVYKAFFTKEDEAKVGDEEDEKKKLKEETSEKFLVPYLGKMTVNANAKSYEKVPEDKKEMVYTQFQLYRHITI